MKEKELKKKLEDLKDRKIDEETLEDVAGGFEPVIGEPGDVFTDFNDLVGNPYAKKKKGKKTPFQI